MDYLDSGLDLGFGPESPVAYTDRSMSWTLVDDYLHTTFSVDYDRCAHLNKLSSLVICLVFLLYKSILFLADSRCGSALLNHSSSRRIST